MSHQAHYLSDLLMHFYRLIAIMLGRLGMTIDECIQAYEELMGSIFGSKAHWSKLSMSANVNAQYDSKKVRTAIEKVLVERNISTDTLLNDGTARRCKMYVLSDCRHATWLT